MAVSQAVAALNLWPGPVYRVLISAGVFALGMMFIAIREYADLPPQFQRYFHVALDLDEAVGEFRKEQGQFADLSDMERRIRRR